LANLTKGDIQATKHIVQGRCEPIQLIASTSRAHTLVEMLGTDAPGRLGHLVHRPQGASCQEPSTTASQQHGQGQYGGHDEEKAVTCS
jgi:hypothetical protein